MSSGGHLPWYDLDPDCPALHRPFKNVVPGLKGFCRSDRLVGKALGYFRGDKVALDEYVENIDHWSGSRKEGASIIMADDAEYCGTTGYYYIKYYGDYSRSFDVDPDAPAKLEALIPRVLELGPMMTFKEACDTFEPLEDPFFVENRFAWHRTYADAWANTPEARRWEPRLQAMRDEYRTHYQPIVEAPGHAEQFRELVETYWFHVTNSANSDGRWPPPPNVTCKFNRDWVEAELASTRTALDELATATKGMSLPETGGQKRIAEDAGSYGYHFTDKNPEDVASLNLYELQHAIYHFHKMVDSGDTDLREQGRVKLREVFAELDRRRIKGLRPAAAEEK